MMSTPERPLKRTRQACEPCRRKKSRCPGEKPTCSHCARLGQVCSYALDRDTHTWSQNGAESSQTWIPQHSSSDTMTAARLGQLERNMAQLQNLLSNRSDASTELPADATRLGVPTQTATSLIGSSTVNVHYRLSPDQIETAASLYSTYCDCQPLPLFSMKNFRHELASRDTELIYAIIALTSRFQALSADQIASNPAELLEFARRLVMHRVFEGPIELSTIQVLCLLTLIEFNDGATARASSYSSLAWDFVQSAGLATEVYSSYSAQVLEERRRCYWSSVMLKRLFGSISGKLTLLPNELSPRYPRSADQPAGSSSTITGPGLPQSDGTTDSPTNVPIDKGIVASVIELSETWARTIRYAHRRGKRQQRPNWAQESEYQNIMARLMDHETRMPYKYRFKPAKFGDYTSEEIRQHRAFWAPWYLNQMFYHAVLCLLNHPLVLSLHLRNFQMTMVPEIFLQHTDDLIQTHTNWVIHLIDQANAKDFVPTDPYPAYCVAVVATIFLQQSYADDENVSRTKQENFDKCLNFLRISGKYWRRVAQLAEKVDMFQTIVAESSQNAASAAEDKTYIDLSLFWEILESCFTSEQSAATEHYFGPSLLSNNTNHSSTDVVSGRLLPPPTRLDRNASTTSTPTLSSTIPQEQFQPNTVGFPSVDDQLQVLAQSYFAQGQDFVNLDDWWYPEQMIT